MINADLIEKMKTDIIEKAGHNREKQAFVRPSFYGFGTLSEDTQECKALLNKIFPCAIISIVGKDSLSITLL